MHQPSSNVVPDTLVGRRPTGAIVGWHVYGDARTAETHFLCFDDDVVELYTAGDGSIGLRSSRMPQDFDMAEYGRYEFHPADGGMPSSALVGQSILAIQRLSLDGMPVGLRLVFASGTVVYLNDFDDVWVSNGALPEHFSGCTTT